MPFKVWLFGSPISIDFELLTSSGVEQICSGPLLRFAWTHSPPSSDTRTIHVGCQPTMWDGRPSNFQCEIMWAMCLPRIQLFHSADCFAPTPHRPSPCIMSTLEPWAVDDTPPNSEYNTATTAMLNTDIETLTASKDTVKATPVKAVFESVIAILTLVRVRLLVPFSFSRLLIGDTTRTRW